MDERKFIGFVGGGVSNALDSERGTEATGGRQRARWRTRIVASLAREPNPNLTTAARIARDQLTGFAAVAPNPVAGALVAVANPGVRPNPPAFVGADPKPAAVVFVAGVAKPPAPKLPKPDIAGQSFVIHTLLPLLVLLWGSGVWRDKGTTLGCGDE